MAKIHSAEIFRIILVLFLTIIAAGNLLRPGLPPTHDGEYHVIRFYEFNQALQNGEWYPRWAPDLNKGYGVPLFNYVYPLPNYVASLLHFLGVSFIDAFKLEMFIATILGAMFIYLWSRQFWGNWAGVTSSIFYTYSPYHFLDIYIRGSVGEVWALGLFPGFLWSVTKLIKEKKLVFLPISSLFFSLVIFSHNILALMFIPFAISYIGFLIYKTKDKKCLVLNAFNLILLGLGISAIFWLPALLERQYVRGLEVYDFTRHFVEVYQLIFPSWGSGFSADLTTEGLSFQIGIANLIALAICITLLVIKRARLKYASMVIFMLGWVILEIFLMLPASSFIWERIPLMQYFQFPWRFLSLVILLSSFLGGSVVYFWKFKLLLPIFILIIVFLGWGYSKPAYYHLRDDNYYTSRSNFIDGTNSPGNTFNTVWFNDSLEKATAKIKEKETTLEVNIAYFPGWKVFVDGIETETKINKNGLIEFVKPSSYGKIEIKLKNTKTRNIATVISMLSFLLILILFYRRWHDRMMKPV